MSNMFLILSQRMGLDEASRLSYVANRKYDVCVSCFQYNSSLFVVASTVPRSFNKIMPKMRATYILYPLFLESLLLFT